MSAARPTATVEGTYACLTRTPMGELASTFTIHVEGDRFTGSNIGALGTLEVSDGRIDANRLTWTMAMPAPLALVLACEAEVNGDALTGTLSAPGFGPMPMHGTRTAPT